MLYKNLCRIKSSGNMDKDPFYGSPSLVLERYNEALIIILLEDIFSSAF